MPIYEYRCSSCGFQKEHLLKVTDAVLTDCPKCGKSSYRKMLTAAGFQLKGSGWYATDFKGSGTKPAAKGNGKDAKAEPKSESAPAVGASAAAGSTTADGTTKN